MIIIGIDYSICSPSVVEFGLDENLEITDKMFIAFCQKKSLAYSKNNCEIIYYDNKKFKNPFDKYQWMRDYIVDWVSPYIDYAAIENYSFGSKGHIFEIAEATILIKLALYNKNIPIRLYDPCSIKKLVTSNGTADKIKMEEFYEKLDKKDRFDLNLPLVKDKVSGNIKDNIVDAFWVAKFLQLELQIRKGIKTLRELPEYQIAVFNQVSNKNKVNLLVRDFITKE